MPILPPGTARRKGVCVFSTHWSLPVRVYQLVSKYSFSIPWQLLLPFSPALSSHSHLVHDRGILRVEGGSPRREPRNILEDGREVEGVQLKLCLLIHGLGLIPPLLAPGPSQRSISNVVPAHPNPFLNLSLFNQTELCSATEAAFCQPPRTHPSQVPFKPLFLILAQEEAECTLRPRHTQDCIS